MPREIPLATYRLQLTSGFGFAAAAALVPYLHALGITHLYASPFLKARRGSTHGYDIVDHNALDPELGGEEDFSKLATALDKAGMGLILDFVPNHMGVGYGDNAWWLDVLERGQASPYAASFDIDWDLLSFRSHAGLLLPILGKPYGRVLEDGEIELRFDRQEGSFSAWYFEHRLPIRLGRYRDIVANVVRAADASSQPAGKELLAIVRRATPTRAEAPSFKAALAAVTGGGDIIDAGLRIYRPKPGDPQSVVALHRLLERQHYRLSHWRVAVSEINYRRFFDINDLAGIRLEHPRTFRDVHRGVMRLIGEGRLHGLRLDHIDGLYDPVQYCRQLQRAVAAARGARNSGFFYTVVEKILAEGEPYLPLAGVSGTTGYETLNDIMRLLLDSGGLPQLDAALKETAGNDASFEDTVETCKRLVIDSILASEFRVLVHLLARIAAGHWSSRDFAIDRLHAALELYVVKFPVYRTYLTGRVVSARDRAIIIETIERAQAQWSGPDQDIFDFLKEVLTLDLVRQGRSGYSQARVRRFTMKLQQFTGPLMAKAMEDTAFYRYFRLLALNEVGGDPALPGLTIPEFHARMSERARITPHAMSATATHDTKRGEDARMRILALAELAGDWTAVVREWIGLNAAFIAAGEMRAPSRAHEYMLYQAMIGAWPHTGADADFCARLCEYAIKAAREGKLESSWADPNETYENALTAFIKSALVSADAAPFRNSLAELAKRAALLGALNSLSQLAIKMTIPGVPDIYQGSENWDLSLVDPDNRRPVDFPARQDALAQLTPGLDWAALGADWPSGKIKFALMSRLLALRRHHADLLTFGRFEPVAVSGPDSDRIVAFARRRGDECVVVIAARHFRQATDGGRHWPRPESCDASIGLPAGFSFSDWLQGADGPQFSETVTAAALLNALPVAVLVSGAATVAN